MWHSLTVALQEDQVPRRGKTVISQNCAKKIDEYDV